jgi:serine/threonine-protein kinase HipA
MLLVVAEVLWAEAGADGVAEFIRRLVFNTLIGNADMHLKNWSLIYPDGRQAALAPGYDFVSTIAYLPDNKMALTLGRSKAMTALSLDQLSYLAAKARLPKKLVLDAAGETVRPVRERLRQVRRRQPLRPDRRQRLRQVHLHEDPRRRSGALAGNVVEIRQRIGKLRQDQFAFEDYRCSTP